MKTLMALLLGAALMLGGCAEQQAQYQQSVIKVNEMALESVKEQSKSNADRRQQSMVFFSQAMVEASKTDDPTDNAVIAFAWGFQSGQPDRIEMPNLKFPEKPADGVDYMQAGVPYFNVIWPWLWGAYGNNDSGGQRITADNGGTVILDSGNAGSYNVADDGAILDASGAVVNDSSQRFTAGRDIITDNCATGDCGAEDEPDDEVGIETCDITGGFLNPVNGKYYADEFFTCSCGSRAAGEC